MIDQQLLIPTLATSSGEPSITIAQLVALMNGESLPLIDQTLLIPTLRGRAGLPAETIADIVALSTGGAAATASLGPTVADFGLDAGGSPFSGSMAVVNDRKRAFLFFFFCRDISGSAGLPVVTSLTLTIDSEAPQVFSNTFRQVFLDAVSGFQRLEIWLVNESDFAVTVPDFATLAYSVAYATAATNNTVLMTLAQINLPVVSSANLNVEAASTASWPVAAIATDGVGIFGAAVAGATPAALITNFANVLVADPGLVGVNTRLSAYLATGTPPLSAGETTVDSGDFIYNAIFNPA